MKSFREFAILVEKEDNKKPEIPFSQRRKEVPGGKPAQDAAKGFSDVKPGGLETRLVDPKFTPQRSERGGGDVWDDPNPAPGRPFKRFDSGFTSNVRDRLRSGTRKDWLSVLRGPESSTSDPWKGSDYKSSFELRQRMRNNPTEPFGDSGFDAPSGSSQQNKPPSKPEPSKPEPPKPEPLKPPSGYAPENKPKPGSEIVKSNSRSRGSSGPSLSVSGSRNPYNYNPTSGSLSLGGTSKPADTTIDPVSVTDVTRKPKPEISPAKPQTRMVTSRVGQSRTFRGSAASSNKPQVPVATQITQALDAVDARNKTKAISGVKAAGIGANILGAIPAAYDAYIRQKEKGASDPRAIGAAVVAPTSGSLASLGSGALALKAGGGPRGAMTAGTAAYVPGVAAGNVAYDAILGPTAPQKRQDAAANRQSQPPQQVSTKPASTRPSVSVGIDPRTGLENQVFLAKKGNQSGYFAPDTSMRGRASNTTNPFERIGRTFAMSGLPGSQSVLRGYRAQDEADRQKRVREIRANQRQYESYNIGKKSFTTFCEQSWPLLGQGDLMKGARPIVRNLIGRGLPAAYGFGGGGIYNVLNRRGRQGALSYQAKSAIAKPVIQSVASKVKDTVFKDDPIRQQAVDNIAWGLENAAPLAPTPGFIKKPIVKAAQKYGPKIAQGVIQHGPKVLRTATAIPRFTLGLGATLLGLDNLGNKL